MKQRRLVSNTLCHALLAVLGFIWVLPICYVVLTAFRAEEGSYKSYIFPKSYTVDNFVNLFNTSSSMIDFKRWFLNTLIIAIFSTLIAAFFTICVAYCMSRLRFRLRKPFMNLAMILGMFPGFMSMIAVYNILKGMGISQSLGALILVNVASSAMGYYICKGFMDTVPKAMDEAARIDGATNFTIFYKIMIPMAKPIVIYQLMSAFMGPWGDYIFPSLLLGDKQASYTVAIGLKWLTDQQRIETYYTQFAAGAVLVSVPIVILFSMLQRYYVEGMSGAVKG